MIRRDWPRTDSPSHWLLIPQREHARLSYQLARAWRGPLLAESPAANEELLQAILHHDDGWQDWDAAPGIDPQHHRPYGFTEMPPAAAQRIWSHSITACRALGPLAGWTAASHFIHLQSKQDEDYQHWQPWLTATTALQAGWLAEWKSLSPQHTDALANRAVLLLQTFDWLSLWLCCRAPVCEDDPSENLDLANPEWSFGPLHLLATRNKVTVTPWPFAASLLELQAQAACVAVAQHSDAEMRQQVANLQSVRWALEAA